MTELKAIGGAVLWQVVEEFYERVRGDGRLAAYFDGIDLYRLKRHQAQLLTQVLGGPAQYGGRDLASAHAGLGITEVDFERVLEHLATALRNAGVEPASIAPIVAAVAATRPQVVGIPRADSG